MRFQIETAAGLNIVRACSPGVVRVGEREMRTSFVLTADRIVAPWEFLAADRLTIDDLAPVLALEPEVILLGTGDACIIAPARLRADVQTRNIGFEFMDTTAACRTFNILVSEDRRVAAALILG